MRISKILPSFVINYYYQLRAYENNIKKVVHHRFFNSEPDIISNYDYFIVSDNKRHCFYGYYDLTPFDSETNLLLNITTDGKTNEAYINTFDLKEGKNSFVIKTNVWNWQQGCRLRWFPCHSNWICYNDIDLNRYCCRVVDIKNKEILKTFSVPIYDINFDGSYGLSLNFSRLGVKRPGYGYTVLPYIEDDLENEGIDLVDLDSGKVRRIVRYCDIIPFLSKQKSLNNYYINHLSFSPSGSKFLFFFLDSSTVRHEAYMFVYNLANGELTPLEIRDKVSHYVWKNDDEIIATVYDDNMNCGYYSYNTVKKERRLFNNEKRDGHPSILGNNHILTDTYPDQKAYQSLFFADKGGEDSLIAKIYSNPLISGERRTDLHPRLNQNNTCVCVDINKCKYREIAVFKLK